MKLRHVLIGLTVILLIFPFCFAQTRRRNTVQPRVAPVSSAPAYMKKLKSFEGNANGTKVILLNGLTVLVSEFRAAPVVDILTYVRAGRIDEPEEAPGIALVLGQMIYKGSAAKPTGDIGKDTAALGGTLRNVIGYDHAVYETIVPSHRWKRALEIQANALLNPSLDPQAVKREIEALILREKGESVYGEDRAQRALKRLAFQTDWSKTASEEDLRGITPAKLEEYHKSRYVASRMILAVCGDVTTSEVLNSVVELYEKLRSGTGSVHVPSSEADQVEFRYDEVRRKVHSSQILFGFHTAAATSADAPALHVLSAILGAGDGSLFSRRLRDYRHLILRQETDLLDCSKFGYLEVHMAVKPEEMDRAEIAVLTEMEILKRQVPEAADVERGKAWLEAEFWTLMQSAEGRARTLARFESMGDWKATSGYIRGIRQVKAEDVSRVARKYLRLDNCSLFEILPEGAEERKLSAQIARRTFEELLEPATDQELAERQKEIEPAIDIPSAADEFHPSEVRYPLRNASVLRGPELYIQEDHVSPMIQIGFFFPGGKLMENEKLAGITSVMLRALLTRGKKDSPDNFFQQLAVYGGEVHPIVTEDYFGFLFSVLSRNVEKGLELLGERIRSAQFDEDAVERQKALQIAYLRAQADDPWTVMRRILDKNLFSGHPYALDQAGSEASLAAISVRSVQAWYEQVVRNHKPLIFVFGDTQGTSLAGYFVRRFSGSRFLETEIPASFPEPLEQRARISVPWSTDESLIVVGFQGPPFGDDDYYPLEILESYMSGVGGRLREELRDRQGLVTDVSVHYDAFARGGSIVLRATTWPGNVQKVLAAVEDEIHRLRDEPMSFREYQTAVNATLGRLTIEEQSRFGQIHSMATAVLSGRASALFEDATDRIKEVAREDLPDLARRILTMDRSVTLFTSVGTDEKAEGTADGGE